MAFLLEGVNGKYIGVIVRFDELRAAYAEFTLARFDTMILHPSGRVCSCAVQVAELQCDRRGNIPHFH